MSRTPKPNEDDYSRFIQKAVASVRDDRFDDAEAALRRAIALDYSRPEVYNTLGVIMEIRGNVNQAQNYYRAALSLDPTYEPSRNNLDRTVGFRDIGKRDLGEA